jgi:hypothetical protein
LEEGEGRRRRRRRRRRRLQWIRRLFWTSLWGRTGTFLSIRRRRRSCDLTILRLGFGWGSFHCICKEIILLFADHFFLIIVCGDVC